MTKVYKSVLKQANQASKPADRLRLRELLLQYA